MKIASVIYPFGNSSVSKNRWWTRMLASCNNCVHRQGSLCLLGRKPKAGELLCEKYSMTPEFRDAIVQRLREELQVEVVQSLLYVTLERKPKSPAQAS